MKSDTLTVVEFGDELLRTQDLDPVYVAIHNANLDPATLTRLCLSYWCFYHLGVSAKLAEVKSPAKYWGALYAAAQNVPGADGVKPWPRGTERRHFRGEQALAAVQEIIRRYKTPEDAVAGITGTNLDAPLTFQVVNRSAQRHRGFGPWIAFKIADMCERVLGYKVDFSGCQLNLYKDPKQGATLVYMQDTYPAKEVNFMVAPWDSSVGDECLVNTVNKYVTLWRKRKAMAPPSGNRLVNVQEIETIFCKYKSHYKGHYPLGKDTLELQHALTGWGDLAAQLREPIDNLVARHHKGASRA